jgi:hypothetical protein
MRTSPTYPEDLMIGMLLSTRDPFEGRGAYRRQVRLRVEGAVALALAIGACGLTAAAWIRLLEPALNRIIPA